MDQVGIRQYQSQIHGMVSARKVALVEDGLRQHRAVKPKVMMHMVEERMILTAMAKTRSNRSIISQSSKITKINFSILGLQEIQIMSKQLGIF